MFILSPLTFILFPALIAPAPPLGELRFEHGERLRREQGADLKLDEHNVTRDRQVLEEGEAPTKLRGQLLGLDLQDRTLGVARARGGRGVEVGEWRIVTVRGWWLFGQMLIGGMLVECWFVVRRVRGG